MPRYLTKRQRRANHQPRHTLALRMVQTLAAASLTTIAAASAAVMAIALFSKG